MKTMPRISLWVLRFLTQAMSAWIRGWEDRNAEVEDYRMDRITTGLWEASTSAREILDGTFNSGYKNLVCMRPETWNPKKVLGKAYVDEVINNAVENAPVPLRAVD